MFRVLHIAVSYEQAGVPVLIAAAQRLQIRVVHGAFRQTGFVLKVEAPQLRVAPRGEADLVVLQRQQAVDCVHGYLRVHV